ncbi:MAG: sigma-70 family RNA polymerase sigma factor [Lentisphaerales bacterium]|nr:sigma-70 family RNA polymerase sigma factor [Lentisphaerales bacterium]
MSEEWVTKQTLLVRIRNKDDQQAWNEFVVYYESFILKILKILKVDANDEDDLTQEILLKLWKSLQNLDYDPKRARFRTWLRTVIRNKYYDFLRKKQRSLKSSLIAEDEAPEIVAEFDEEEMLNIIDQEWRKNITQIALKNLEKVFSENAILAFKMSLEEVATKEIASQLNIAENSVYTLRKRVEAKLIREVKRLKEEVEF